MKIESLQTQLIRAFCNFGVKKKSNLGLDKNVSLKNTSAVKKVELLLRENQY
jgi:hypothetical protein